MALPRSPATVVYVLTGLLACISFAPCAAYPQQAKFTVSVSSRPEVPVLSPSRAAALLQLEMDSETRVGVCAKGSSLWQGFPHELCRWQYCLWSERAQCNIDLWLKVFSPMKYLALDCQKPQGGQAGLKIGEQPEVAFIVTMHNHGSLAAQCLLELFRTAGEVASAEFILVDDGSTENVSVAVDTGRQLQHLFGAHFRHVRNENATGYGPANNMGVQLAKSKYVALINTDAHVVNGWLRPLMDTLRLNSGIGMVGPLLVGDNNLITEASSLITAGAGAAILYRRLPAGQLPSFINRRFRADYLSTAASVMARDVFLKLGGFDAAYREGYWEDTDLAMRVRQAGLDVVLQPLSIVYHQEGGTFGSGSLSAAAQSRKDKLMESNGAIFRERWREMVAAEQHCPQEADLDFKLQRLNSPSILYVEEVRPQPSRDAGSLRAEAVMKILLEAGFSVTYAATFAGFAYTEPLYSTQMRFMGVEVWPDMDPNMWSLTIGEKEHAQCRFDIILVARKSVTARVLPLLRKACSKVPIIFDTVDVHFIRESRARMVQQQQVREGVSAATDTSLPAVYKWLDEQGSANAEMRAYRDAELKLVRETDLTIVVSEQEQSVIHRYLPGAPVHIVSLIMPEISRPVFPCAQRQGLLFVGSLGHPPNAQAITHLLQEILPALRTRMPEAMQEGLHIHIVGSGNPAGVKHLLSQYKDIATLHLNLSSELLELLLARVKAFVAPLLVGGGVKGKINQSMANGLPVVAYEVAMEGIDAEHGQDVMVAQDKEEFAAHIVELHANCNLWSRLSRGGLGVISKNYTEEKARVGLRNTMQALGVPKPGPEQRHCRASSQVAGRLRT